MHVKSRTDPLHPASEVVAIEYFNFGDIWKWFGEAVDSAMVGEMVSFSLAILFKIVVKKKLPAENRSCLLVTPRIKQVLCFNCTKEAGSQEQEENKRSSRRKRGEKEN
ncbi:hypothetical protein COLO4_38380 [Corchorus olitorius]|uniref:Uncharacterized protein n=1 Tax=Corchorus olitorius TaxID=93759 RepID=A0A1R3FVA7_9ROSI|nr:hypothetical protein COLO4_38380 [Corchorus olitorius]